MLPTSRYFPRRAAVGRWLNSSPIVALIGAWRSGAGCSLADHSDRVLAATFRVRTASGSGTAFYIGSGEWLTNHHVVDDLDAAARVTLVRGDVRLAAAVVRSLPGYDLALLRTTPPASVLPLRLAASRTAVAAQVAVAGFPRGTLSLTRGLVSEYAPFADYRDRVWWVRLAHSGVLLQTDAPIGPGNSGGPIVDDCGAVAAIATFESSYTQRGQQFEVSTGVVAETIAANLASLGSVQAPAAERSVR